METLDVKRWRTTFLRKVFAICSAFQAFSWFVLATICIVLYYVKPGSVKEFEKNMTDEGSSFVDFLSYSLYLTLFEKDITFIETAVQPLRFHIIVWIYLGLNGCWAAVSVAECLALFKGKNRQYGRRLQITSGVLLLLICSLDVVLFSLALYDYRNINIFDRTHLKESTNEDGTENCDYQANLDYQLRYVIGRKIAFGVLATLAARGFLLWLFNAAVGFYSVVHPIQVLQMPPLLQYEEPIPRPKLVPEDKNKSTKSGSSYVDDQSSDLFSSLPPEKRNWYYGQAPLPLTYYDDNQEQPKFVNSRHRQPSNSNERF